MAIAVGPGGSGTSEDVVLCEVPADFDGAGSRRMIAVLLRPQLDEWAITPSELLYGSRQLKQLIDQRGLVETVLGRVATLQGRLPGQEPRARRAVLQAALEATMRRARAADAVLASVPAGRNAVAAYLAGRIQGGAELGPALVRAAVARDIAGLSGWSAKFEHLLGLIWQESDEPLRQTVDELLGDLLGCTAATREMMPARAPLGVTLGRLMEMSLGQAPPGAGTKDRLAMLSPLFRKNRLPVARAAVLERIRRQLGYPDALAGGQPAEEAEALRRFTDGLITNEGVFGGAGMADVLTRRAARRFPEGGVRALRRAVTAVSDTVADLPARVHYLAALCVSEQAAALGEEVGACLEAALSRDGTLEPLLFRSPDPAAARGLLTAAAAALEGCELPAAVRRRMAGRVERAVDAHMASGALVARLRGCEPRNAAQAWRLSELVAGGLITDTRALAAVRQRLSELMRQPGFFEEMAALRTPSGTAVDPKRFRAVIDRLAAAVDTAAAGGGGDDATVTVTVAAPATVRPAVASAGTEDATISLGRPPANARPPAAAPAGVPASRPPPAADGRCPNCFAHKGGAAQCPECEWIEGTAPTSPAHLPPGTWLLGRYRVGKLLGQGGFGATYLGWDDRLQIRVAVKEYFPTHLVAREVGGCAMAPFTPEHRQSFAKGIAKFLEEARILARLRDIREIVSVQDYFEENATAYLVMELLQGRTMKKYIADHGGRIDYRKALAILMPIMKALHSIHDQGMVHRDVSPDNIFVPAAGGAKLLDFGAARAASTDGGAGLTVILKPGYAPPEQYFSDSRQGPWTDIYALGASFYCSLIGKAPLDSTRRLQEDTLQPPSALGVVIPPELERVLMTALSLRRQDRFQSMREMIGALGKAG